MTPEYGPVHSFVEFRIGKHHYGWFLTIPALTDGEEWEEQIAEMPGSLKAVARYAMSLNCRHVMFDADGTHHEALTIHKWD